MKKYPIIIPLLLLILSCSSPPRSTTTGVVLRSVPDTINTSDHYIFYLHGGIIQMEGIDAVSPYFGRYEYTKILQALANAGYIVISERRPKDSKTPDYAKIVAGCVSTLLDAGTPPENITIVGASMGAGIAIDASIQIGNDKIKYCLLGICKQSSWDYYLRHYTKDEIQLRGKFLSIYEISDESKSCDAFIGNQPTVASYEEIALDMGISHGFLYKPYDEWLFPLFDWINRDKPVNAHPAR